MKNEFVIETDLAVVIRRNCGCFWKFYFEIETDDMAIDSDRDRCATHKNGIEGDIEAANQAWKRANHIRLSVRTACEVEKEMRQRAADFFCDKNGNSKVPNDYFCECAGVTTEGVRDLILAIPLSDE
jgi:hypothetical protein